MAYIKTKYSGIYYKEHTTRKNGVRKDRYFVLRYTANGVRHEEGFGWESEGYTESAAIVALNEIKDNIKKGTGYFSLKEKADMALAEKEAKLAEKRALEHENITYRQFYEEVYKPSYIDPNKPKQDKKGANENYILPVIGDLPMKDVLPMHIEKIRTNMMKKGRRPATINMVIGYLRNAYNIAIQNDYFNGKNPVSKIKRLKQDNRRIRFLSREDAAILFARLKQMPTSNVYDMALLSLCCGLRAGEIFKLQVVDINFTVNRLAIRDPKSGKNRILPMPAVVVDMLRKRCRYRKSNDFVFCTPEGNQLKEVSNQYQVIVNELFNQNVDDVRNKVVFHTLRHTFASWLAMDGVDIFTIKELMGHSDIKMTQRYMHLAPNKFDAAMKTLERPLPLLSDQAASATSEVK